MTGEFEFMDLLYSRYSNPFEFLRPYIEIGRFGELVTSIILQENERREKKVKKEDEDRLWLAYVHSYSEISFDDWKEKVFNSSGDTAANNKDDEMTDSDIRSIVGKLFRTD